MKYLFFCICCVLGLLACNQNKNYAPKPRGYFRLEFPEKAYQLFDSNAHYSFEYPQYAKMYLDSADGNRPNWYNLTFPAFNARLHLSYYKIDSKKKFDELVEDSRKLAFKHTVKATGIDEGLIEVKEHNVYGVFYTIDGNTASSAQFFLTDSTRNFLRAALYFNEKPQPDSIQPVVDFIKTDIDRMIKTFRWKP
ncbi:gliding motility lipoprotein GldD [Pelobium manganitolerans]|uniref:Gliding motility lipoprotein GldD n=1 Tax=Pelobium manganitolerans TaxID=1842495 RepID=A0A419SBU6_9SPHI|nr:gliding motility lipoprotein GldD [Pelobium manganitolerans]RKD20140.1 gliding motility lipoprotein GldD [Pelobium manganitolerans]